MASRAKAMSVAPAGFPGPEIIAGFFATGEHFNDRGGYGLEGFAVHFDHLHLAGGNNLSPQFIVFLNGKSALSDDGLFSGIFDYLADRFGQGVPLCQGHQYRFRSVGVGRFGGIFLNLIIAFKDMGGGIFLAIHGVVFHVAEQLDSLGFHALADIHTYRVQTAKGVIPVAEL